MSAIFDSLDTNYKRPTGAVKKGEMIYFRIGISKYLNPNNVQLVIHERDIWWDSKNITMHELESTEDEYVYFAIEISDLDINIYEYFFVFSCNVGRQFLVRDGNKFNAIMKDVPNDKKWQLTIYEANQTHPNMNDGIMYQIFPDRFCKYGEVENKPNDRIYRNWGELPFYKDENITTDYFGGNLRGITKKLKYLKQLNVSIIYLNPIWEAHSNHRYNTANYENVDPLLGNKQDLEELIKKAHELGMIIILDTVLNHTGSDSIYFNKNNRYPENGAYQGNSKYDNWYSFFYDNYGRKCYQSWWGFETLPTINQGDPKYIEQFFGEGGIVDKWYSYGIDGLRLDVADELRNETLEKVYEASKRNRDFIIIVGEVWDDASNKYNYGKRMKYFLGHELTSVMNYPIHDMLLAYIRYGGYWAFEFDHMLKEIFIEEYPREIAYSLMNFLSTHDTVRAITKLAGKEVDDRGRDWQVANDELTKEEYKIGKDRLKIAYLILYFLPGVPSIFYGDETGLYGQKDPFCRKCMPWGRLDKKLLSFFRNLGKLRSKMSSFLKDADFEIVEINDEVCVLKRKKMQKEIYVLVNRTDKVIDISRYLTKCNKVLFRIGKQSEQLTNINPYGGLVFEKRCT